MVRFGIIKTYTMKRFTSKSRTLRVALGVVLTMASFAFTSAAQAQISGTYYGVSAGITNSTQTLYSYSTVYDNGNSNTPVFLYVTFTVPGATSYSYSINPGFPSVPISGNGPSGMYLQLGGGSADNTSVHVTAQTSSGAVSEDIFFEISGYASFHLAPLVEKKK